MTKKTIIPAFSITPPDRTYQHGFTLIECATVLIILAFLITGVTIGTDLIGASKYRKIATDAEEYIQAVQKFNDKYQAFPGDMVHATRIWGRADGDATVQLNCANPVTNNSNVLGTCNGNGDGTIARDGTTAQIYEMFRAWQQLSLGGLIRDNFTGIAGSAGTSQALTGQNIPMAAIRSTGYDLTYLSASAATARHFAGINYGHVLHYGKQVTGNNLARGSAIPDAEAENIDKKFDDGKPAQGDIIAMTDAACVTSSVVSTAQYYKTDSSSATHCALMFITGF